MFRRICNVSNSNFSISTLVTPRVRLKTPKELGHEPPCISGTRKYKARHGPKPILSVCTLKVPMHS